MIVLIGQAAWPVAPVIRIKDRTPAKVLATLRIITTSVWGSVLNALPCRSHRLCRSCLRPRPQPPDQPSGHDQPDRNQLRAGHRSAKHRSPPRIVPQELQKESRHAVNEHTRAEYLAIEFPALQQPHQKEEVRELHRRLEQLRRLQRYVQRSPGNPVRPRIGEGHTPPALPFFSITASRGKASNAPNRVSQRQPRRKRIAGS